MLRISTRVSMNSAITHSFRCAILKLTHALCTTIALVSAFHTLEVTIYEESSAFEANALAALTLTFGHASLFLSHRVYLANESSCRYITFFAIVCGYLGLTYGLYLLALS